MRTFLFAVAIVLTAGCRHAETSAPCETPESDGPQPKELVQMRMKGLRFHATDTVIIEIPNLRGELIPTREGKPADTDDANSYVIRLASATIRVPETSITADFRDYVLGGTGAPIDGLRVRAKDGLFQFTGRLKPGVPFDITAGVEMRDDGKMHVTTRRLETAGIGVRGLSEKTGVDLHRILGSHDDRGVHVDGNDMSVDVAKAFPAPHMEGTLLSAKAVDGALELRYGPSPKLSAAGKKALPPVDAVHYIQHYGGVLASGKVTVIGADQHMVDADPTDAFDYSGTDFAEIQLPASTIRVSRGQTTTFLVPDLDEVEVKRVRGRD